MKKMPIERLRLEIERETEIITVSKALAYAWRSFTSRQHDNWTQANPAIGQSDATALLILSKLGGKIMKSELPGYGAYYYNVLDDGRRLDLTSAKFPEGMVLPDGVPISPKELLDSEDASDHHLTERLSLLTDSFDYVLGALKRHSAPKAKRRKTPT